MLRITIKLNQNIDIANYGKLKSILKFVTKFFYETFEVRFVTVPPGLRPGPPRLPPPVLPPPSRPPPHANNNESHLSRQFQCPHRIK